ncbi:MAG: Magnesium/cobalt efflux protein [candidate division TM6 bacterium GW2011_GWF2_32_72]|nr:MAG: Magnesium/cobalt efflux protein [candidate division TM6 bacterium GW2011_GWF2_32_72]
MGESLLGSELIGFIISLSISGLFSFLETSITSLRLFNLKELASSTKKYTKLFYTLEKYPHRVIVTILIANNLANVSATVLLAKILTQIFDSLNITGGVAFTLDIFITTGAMLILSDALPKSVAKVHGEKLLKSTLWITNAIFYLMSPFVYLLNHLTNWVIYLVGGKDALDNCDTVTSEKEIQFLIDYINEKGLMDPDKTEMLQNIFQLGQTPAREIMIPATDIVSLESNTSLDESLKVFLKYQYSRLPIYEGQPDNIVGMLHLKDVLMHIYQHENRKPIKDLLRPILFIPESLKVNQMLREFRQQNRHIAIVVNEFGVVDGLVTLEDVLEEIVGEISDEHEYSGEKVTPLESEGWLIDGGINLEDLEKLLKIQFKTEEAITLGGFLTEQLQCLPHKGDQLLYKDFWFKVQQATPKRVLKVIISQAAKT